MVGAALCVLSVLGRRGGAAGSAMATFAAVLVAVAASLPHVAVAEAADDRDHQLGRSDGRWSGSPFWVSPSGTSNALWTAAKTSRLTLGSIDRSGRKRQVAIGPVEQSATTAAHVVAGDGATAFVWEATPSRRLPVRSYMEALTDPVQRETTTGVFLRYLSPAGALGPPIRVARYEPDDGFALGQAQPIVGSLEGKGAIVAWQQGGVRVRAVSRDGVLSPPVVLAKTPENHAVWGPSLVALGRGRTLVGWVESFNRSCTWRAQQLDDAAAPLGPPYTIATRACGMTSIARTGRGTLYFGWSEHLREAPSCSAVGGRYRVMVRRQVGDALSPARHVATADADFSMNLRIAGFDDGRAAVVWTGRRVSMRPVRSDGSFAPVRYLSPPHDRVQDLSIAAGANRALVTWERLGTVRRGRCRTAPFTVQASVRSSTGRSIASRAWRASFIGGPVAALAPTGRHPVVAWERNGIRVARLAGEK